MLVRACQAPQCALKATWVTNKGEKRMAFQFNLGTGAIVTTEGQDKWQYATTFRVISQTPTSVKLTDILAPLDKRTTAKYALSKIANVYQTLGGDSVPVAERSSNATGTTLFCELTTILTKPNPVTAGAIIQVPVQARIELRVPNDGDIDDIVIGQLVSYVTALLLNSSGDAKVTSELLRGALVPAD